VVEPRPRAPFFPIPAVSMNCVEPEKLRSLAGTQPKARCAGSPDAGHGVASDHWIEKVLAILLRKDSTGGQSFASTLLFRCAKIAESGFRMANRLAIR